MDGEFDIYIEPDGQVRFVHSDDAASLFEEHVGLATQRASHVEPDGKEWTVDLRPVGGPVWRGFSTKRQALEAEVNWLEARLFANEL